MPKIHGMVQVFSFSLTKFNGFLKMETITLSYLFDLAVRRLKQIMYCNSQVFSKNNDQNSLKNEIADIILFQKLHTYLARWATTAARTKQLVQDLVTTRTTASSAAPRHSTQTSSAGASPRAGRMDFASDRTWAGNVGQGTRRMQRRHRAQLRGDAQVDSVMGFDGARPLAVEDTSIWEAERRRAAQIESGGSRQAAAERRRAGRRGGVGGTRVRAVATALRGKQACGGRHWRERNRGKCDRQ